MFAGFCNNKHARPGDGIAPTDFTLKELPSVYSAVRNIVRVCFPFFCLNSIVSADDGAKGQAQPGRVLYDVNQVQSATDDSFHNGALVLCNPGTASLTDIDFQVPESPAEGQLCAAAPKDGGDGEITSSSAALCRSRDVTEDIEYLGKKCSPVDHPPSALSPRI